MRITEMCLPLIFTALGSTFKFLTLKYIRSRKLYSINQLSPQLKLSSYLHSLYFLADSRSFHSRYTQLPLFFKMSEGLTLAG